MKIQCLLKREGGTKIELGGTEYHFKLQEDGTHVAEVTEQSHINRLLSIKEAYRQAGEQPALKPFFEPVENAPVTAINNPLADAPIVALNNPLANDTDPDPALAQVANAGDPETPAIEQPAPATPTATEPAPAKEDPAPAATEAPLGNSITEQDALIAEAKNLGIKANRNWGVERLKREIEALKGD